MGSRRAREIALNEGKVPPSAVLRESERELGGGDGRIDDSTHDRFPGRAFRGGVRLEPPAQGRRVGGRRAHFDGPFLESKEVIGGLFFLRMASMDEAVEWARQTGFVHHGALEIRELWRT
jgi:hypothetical protein